MLPLLPGDKQMPSWGYLLGKRNQLIFLSKWGCHVLTNARIIS